MKRVLLLGATGSIGGSTFALWEKNQGVFEIVGASAHSRFSELESLAEKFKIPHLLDTREKITSEKLQDFLALTKPDIVLNAIVGFAGMEFSLEVLRAGIPLALANKESLVAAGKLMMETSEKFGAPIIPVDSEHAAIFECLNCHHEQMLEMPGHEASLPGKPLPASPVKGGAKKVVFPKYRKFRKILLTCSGGPFFGKTRAELENITPSQALAHPNWDMGAKISIDSATLANKSLEFFEAMHLFSASQKQVEIVIHRESIVHSMVEFADSSILSQMAPPNMELPIAMALNFPQKFDMKLPRQDFSNLNLSFYKPDRETFRTLQVLEKCAEKMGNLPVAFNAANEVAVDAFLKEQIKFLEIFDVLEFVCEKISFAEISEISDVYAADLEARNLARGFLKII